MYNADDGGTWRQEQSLRSVYVCMYMCVYRYVCMYESVCVCVW
jgi:hypothetical protein